MTARSDRIELMRLFIGIVVVLWSAGQAQSEDARSFARRFYHAHREWGIVTFSHRPFTHCAVVDCQNLGSSPKQCCVTQYLHLSASITRST